MTAGLELEDWVERQCRRSAGFMAKSVSAVGLRKERPGLGQVMVPARGSVLASPVPAAWDPEPDYFFHWLRDSALVMDAASELIRGSADDGERTAWQERWRDFVAFSLRLDRLSGRRLVTGVNLERRVKPAMRPHFRGTAELAAIEGDRLRGEVRFNPDGTLDLLRWTRPQHDGPALRALALLRHAPLCVGDAERDALAGLLRADLTYVARHAGEPCAGPWEEESGRHYYTEVVEAAALLAGAVWAEAGGDAALARTCREAGLRSEAGLDDFVSGDMLAARAGEGSGAALDSAVILGVLHAGRRDSRHGLADPRLLATLDRLCDHFAAAYPLNRAHPEEAPALGRYPDDGYFGGGPWFVTTLAAAELHYRRASLAGADGAADLARGDAFMATVRRLVPEDGSLSEQADAETGAPVSARHLAWSYAAFVTAAAARRRAVDF
ncbi:glycoside hydrolase family 15 protein [Geminicoccaceae bacterium 1502E]|nr:glycoside hydrolase family 15 protein [Geminicoccaceae bacterium 1502E]